jgi:hypothetical protein
VIESKYIDNPLLYCGKKFHLRIHVVIMITGNKKYAWLARRGSILVAEKDYVNDDYGNTDIHDTHLGTDRDHGEFPDDAFPDVKYETVYIAVKKLMDVILCDEEIKKFPDQHVAYSHYGMDIMFRSDGSPVIIEINRIPGVNVPVANHFYCVRYSVFSYLFFKDEDYENNDHVKLLTCIDIPYRSSRR